MPRWLQLTLNLVSIAAGAYAAHAQGSPTPLVVAGGITTAVGAIAQKYNTDGTPQTVAYQPPPKP